MTILTKLTSARQHENSETFETLQEYNLSDVNNVAIFCFDNKMVLKMKTSLKEIVKIIFFLNFFIVILYHYNNMKTQHFFRGVSTPRTVSFPKQKNLR